MFCLFWHKKEANLHALEAVGIRFHFSRKTLLDLTVDSDVSLFLMSGCPGLAFVLYQTGAA